VPPALVWQQNRARERQVPEAVIERLIGKWEAPNRTEAHRLTSIVRGSGRVLG